MNQVFRGKFLQGLKSLINNQSVQPQADVNMTDMIDLLYKKEWIVYAKQPFGGPEQVIEYPGRYTNKVAISNHRLQAYDTVAHKVTFEYKDYTDGGKQKQMVLHDIGFVRRFEQHILPHRFTKIRSYGYLSNRGRRERVNQILKTMDQPPHPPPMKIPWQVRLLERYGKQANECPCCHQPTLRLLAVVHPKAGRIESGYTNKGSHCPIPYIPLKTTTTGHAAQPPCGHY